MASLRIAAAAIALSGFLAPLAAQGFLCADRLRSDNASVRAGAAAKAAQDRVTGTRTALLLFTRFRGEGIAQVPAWAADVFSPDRPGSFSHFYDTMSFGKLRVRGQVAPRVYESDRKAGFYLAADDTARGRYDLFARPVLEQADQEIDFARFDNDGPDGLPDSGDDDGTVDAVFLMLDTVPARFLRGPANGIGELGFEADLATQDPGISGRPITISPRQGTVQQGRTFAGAMGALCHEYGHVLGLGDLYDTGYLGRVGAPPELDSAGAGAWDLMGWGALGWHGDDGPNSLSAFGRMQLGWAAVEEVAQEEVRLEEVGRAGRLLKIPLTGREYFLVEYRTRTGTWYDRDIPGEGLLIWHVQLPGAEAMLQSRRLDLECADGRWLDAAYPLGRQADPQQGGDNLDFWAHDVEYAQAHGGNTGDATDPFDGVRYRAFTPDTNPASYSEDGRLSVRLEEIRVEAGVALTRVQTRPLILDLTEVAAMGEDGDQIAVAGELLRLSFKLANRGGLAARNTRARIHTDDPLVEIVQAEAVFGDLAVDRTSPANPQGGFPALRFLPGFAGRHTATVSIEVFADSALVEEQEVAVSALSPRTVVQAVEVLDDQGNGDGMIQGGEFIRLGLELEAPQSEWVEAFKLSLRPLSAGVTRVAAADVPLEYSGEGRARSQRSPEFLVPTDLPPGSWLNFELAVTGAFGTWSDTLALQVQPGPDQTPPRLTEVLSRPAEQGLRLVLPASHVLEGGRVESVQVVVYSPEDTVQLATVPLELERQGEWYEGVWATPEPGEYLVAVVVRDRAGNQGRSAIQTLWVPRAVSRTSAWQALSLPTGDLPLAVSRLVLAPGSPEVIYAVAGQGLWRSLDWGATWARTGWMEGEYLQGIPMTAVDVPGLLVDPHDSMTLYANQEAGYIREGVSGYYGVAAWKSRDGGMTWTSVLLPDDYGAILALDPARPGRVYARIRSGLVVSEDGGVAWKAVLEEEISFCAVHPLARDVLWAGQLFYWNGAGLLPGVLFHSTDGGATWGRQDLEVLFDQVMPDPGDPAGLYAVRQNALWHSADVGAQWVEVGPLPEKRLQLTDSGVPDLLLAWRSVSGGTTVWRSGDGGRTWARVPCPAGSGEATLFSHPRQPQRLFLVGSTATASPSAPGCWSTRDGGEQWETAPLPLTGATVGTVVFDRAGRLYTGSADAKGPGLCLSTDGGQVQEWCTEWAFPLRGRWPPVYLSVLYLDPARPDFLVANSTSSHYWTPDGRAGWSGQVMWSGDRGRTLLRPGDGSLRTGNSCGEVSYSSVVSDPRADGVCYLGGGGGGIWRISGAGAIWEERNGNLPGVRSGYPPQVQGFGQDPQDPEVLYAGLQDSLWISRDAGMSWSYAGKVAEGENILYLAGHPLAPHPLYAATSQGVYRSVDQARSWTRLVSVKTPGRRVMRLRFAPADPQRLYWITGPELQETRDGGATWRSLGDGVAGHPWFSDVAVDPLDPEVIYAATPWGVYRLDTRQVGTAVTAADPVLPGTPILAQNYPNPFNPQTTIAYQLPRAGPVRLTLYNAAGQRVKTLVDQVQPAGSHCVSWDGTGDGGRELGSGVYFCRLTVGPFQQTRRLVLLK
ncbi:MAG: FlgD immunoglobulin-like domain containing protein [Candidatus Latescibacterota bacterium]|jgi:M6 family metalloprotease-like protein